MRVVKLKAMRIIIERIPAPMASLYEKCSRMVIESYYRQLSEEIVSGLKKGIILDLGTGPGYLPIEIVKKSPSIKVHGIDLSARLIRMAQTNASKAGVADRLSFETGNATEMRFGDNSYDMVISTGMLHHLKNPLKMLRECYRVLKPGGEAWIYDPAQVSTHIDPKKLKASLTLLERLMYMLFPLFTLINPSPTYKRDQVVAMISATPFSEHRIKEENNELQIRLKK